MPTVLMRALFTSLLAPSGPALPPVVSRTPLVFFHVDSGGCEACGLEVEALMTGNYGLAEAGVTFADSPRTADMLLVTGCCSRMMAPVVKAAWETMPQPKGLLAVGACAIDGGPFSRNYAVLGGLQAQASVDCAIPGCPPSPDAILDGIIRLLSPTSPPPPRVDA
ncbi:NADH-quinone oxidoreductase subunit B family protein [Acetobacter conturbans]|uniref:NADH-quinone oxidoreductase subunit B n=1 Tax=Acetobacter conturbans TaxID=1737472 RepID=A0ABX0JX93_9PROT|nr:NADH-quinone oxidoreductase subunit B [Acetobacter conturbans]NHN87171.1 NADH-quinone oxidoreductase subunit B [Acetobacter conturbans]